MSDLEYHGVLDHCIWSYNTDCETHDSEQDIPISIGIQPGWRDRMHAFVERGPYWCDGNDDQDHNDHRRVNLDLWQRSFCHVVIETLFDADQSGGAFITEKTYKPIAFFHPFVVAGEYHTLQRLRDLGFETFGNYMDESYDNCVLPAQRIDAMITSLKELYNRPYRDNKIEAMYAHAAKNVEIYRKVCKGKDTFFFPKRRK